MADTLAFVEPQTDSIANRSMDLAAKCAEGHEPTMAVHSEPSCRGDNFADKPDQAHPCQQGADGTEFVLPELDDIPREPKSGNSGDTGHLDATRWVRVEFGRVTNLTTQPSEMVRGRVIKLDNPVNSLFDIFVDDLLVARGTVRVNKGKLSLHVVELVESMVEE